MRIEWAEITVYVYIYICISLSLSHHWSYTHGIAVQLVNPHGYDHISPSFDNISHIPKFPILSNNPTNFFPAIILSQCCPLCSHYVPIIFTSLHSIPMIYQVYPHIYIYSHYISHYIHTFPLYIINIYIYMYMSIYTYKLASIIIHQLSPLYSHL